jgi:hypothetical protein
MAPGGKGKSNQVFGQTMKKKSTSGSRYQRQAGNGGGGGLKSNKTVYKSADASKDDAEDPAVARRRFRQQQGQEIDKRFGYEKFALSANNKTTQSASRRGWLFQMLPTTVRT